MSTAAGYSGTPLAKKLGIKEGFKMIIHNKPKHYFKLFDTLPEGVKEISGRKEDSADFIHLFCTSEADLKKASKKFLPALKKNGMMWVSWPKGKSKIDSELKREPIRDLILSIGLVDIKVAAIDEDWSGLKFVYRVKDR